jgi:hypothetical protein
MPLRRKEYWRVLVSASLILLIAMIALEMLVPEFLFSVLAEEAIGVSEVFLSGILLFDIYLGFLDARNKVLFLRRNMLRILVFLPWGAIFRGFALLKMEAVFAELPLYSELIATERAANAAKGIRLAGKVEELIEV